MFWHEIDRHEIVKQKNILFKNSLHYNTLCTLFKTTAKLNIAIRDPGIPAVFANPESRDWRRRDYKNLLKWYFFTCQLIKIIILAV